MSERARRSKKDPARRLQNAVEKRAAGRARWRKWAALRRAGKAVCRVEYDGAVLARLIIAGWLPRRSDDVYRPEEVGAAIDEMIARADLPKKKC